MKAIGTDGNLYTATHSLKGRFISDSARYDYVLNFLRSAPSDHPLWDELLSNWMIDVPVCITDVGIAVLHPASLGFWTWQQLRHGIDNNNPINFSLVHNQELTISGSQIKEARESTIKSPVRTGHQSCV